MDRRGFLGSILAACAAPAIVRADSLMRIVPPETLVLPPDGALGYWASKNEFSKGCAARDLWAHAYEEPEYVPLISLNDYTKRVIEPAMRRITLDMEHRMLADLYGRA